MSLADIRRSYRKSILRETTMADTPVEQFKAWFSDALVSDIIDPSAMTLATVGSSGKPSSRIVLLKGVDEHGFVFFSNYQSLKAEQITENPWVSLSFYWADLERQIRIEGSIEKISPEESDLYYQSRPLDSRIGAWASPQSHKITREQLEARVASYTRSLGTHPPRPPFWGGFRVLPQRLEFWQGRPSRLHDRIVYSLQDNGQWQLTRLAP